MTRRVYSKALKGHKLISLKSFDSLSHKSDVECECGWTTVARSIWRGREQHKEHKDAVRSSLERVGETATVRFVPKEPTHER